MGSRTKDEMKKENNVDTKGTELECKQANVTWEQKKCG